jgi:hypothetical protein
VKRQHHGWPDLDPAVLAELRKIVAIRENPYALLHAQYVSLHNQYTLQHGTRDDFMVPPRTAAEEFDSKIRAAIYVAHFCIALSNSKKLIARKEIARCARALANVLQALKRDDKEILLHFLPYRRQATFDDFVTATRELADEARQICSLAGRPSGRSRRVTQRCFVSHLLDAAADADRKLTLNPRSERGTLIDAIELLLPYLPQEISKMPSFSTLKRLRDAWGSKSRKKSKIPLRFDPAPT